MSKPGHKLDDLKKLTARLIKSAPHARPPETPPEPLTRMLNAFLEYDSDTAKAEAASKKILSNMVDFNELRVTPAIELAAILGVRYPFSEARSNSLHRTLQSVFDREHQMSLGRLDGMKKAEIRGYLQSLNGINPYVEAVMGLECYDICAAPVDLKLLLWFIAKDALPPDCDVRTAQGHLEKIVKAGDMMAFHRGARREMDDWAPKAWPAAPKPIAPPPEPEPVPAPIEVKPAPRPRSHRKAPVVAAIVPSGRAARR